MYKYKVDYTNMFCSLMNEYNKDDKIFSSNDFKDWQKEWHERRLRNNCSLESSIKIMRTANPLVIPRNHIVEKTLMSAEKNDFAPLNSFIKALEKPYDKIVNKDYQIPSPLSEKKYQTFCGT